MPGTFSAMCENQLSACAPCQCLTPAGMIATLPGTSLCAGTPLFLVPAAAGGADKDLPAALIGVMYVLCVAASRFERDVEQGELALFNVG